VLSYVLQSAVAKLHCDMVKIDDTYFDNQPEEEIEDTFSGTSTAEDDQSKPLLADLLEIEMLENETSEGETAEWIPDQTLEKKGDSDEINLEGEALEETSNEDTDEKEDIKGQTARRSKPGLWFWLGGDILGQPAFRKYIPAFIAILIMGLIHVSSNYQIISKRRRIDALETQVKDLTYKHLESVGELTRRSIGSNFEQQLKAMGSDLEAPAQQSIILYRSPK